MLRRLAFTRRQSRQQREKGIPGNKKRISKNRNRRRIWEGCWVKLRVNLGRGRGIPTNFVHDNLATLCTHFCSRHLVFLRWLLSVRCSFQGRARRTEWPYLSKGLRRRSTEVLLMPEGDSICALVSMADTGISYALASI